MASDNGGGGGGNKLGLSNRLSDNVDSIGQLRQNLVRATLAKQTLEYEKSELKMRIDDLEREIKTDMGKKVRRVLFYSCGPLL